MAENKPTTGDINFFGITNFRGQRKRFGIKRRDRSKHTYVIGKTGMGKSTMLENMTIQDIANGEGVAVVDPHGEYAERLLDFIPKHRVNDVVYLNPADINFPIGFNIMENVSEDQRHILAAGLLGIFKKIFGEEVFSARMEYLLANAILGLLEIPGTTLIAINRMFGEKPFRQQIVAQIKDPIVKGFWENEFAKYPEQFMREAVASVQNKVGQFSANPLIRNIIGQPHSSIDLRDIMDNQKILIVNLSKGRMGEENARLLGAMIVTRIYLAAMGRVDLPETARKDFYLYVDEFQNFATESFASILSEARKYHLNLTVAHQYVNQMEEMVQHAIFGNVGTMICFRVGGEDAELLEKEFMPEFTGEDLVNLGFKNVYLKLMIDGITSRPFSAETMPPFETPVETYRDTVIQVSRERYGTPRSIVEERIRTFTLSSGAPVIAGDVVKLSAEQAAAGAAVPIPTLSQPGSSTALPPPPPAEKPERQMYEAVCAVDGKRILLPFKPDNKRPVYCEEHMDMIKFRQKTSEVAAAPEASDAPKPAQSPEPRASVQSEPRPHNSPRINTSRRDERLPERRPANQNPSPVKAGEHLPSLREAISEALKQKNAVQTGAVPTAAPASSPPPVPQNPLTVPEPSAPPQNKPQPQSVKPEPAPLIIHPTGDIMKPDQSIRFD